MSSTLRESTLREQVKAAGVVGAGGAGFPTHVKLDAKARVLLVNAAECEPLIRVDQLLLVSHTDEFFAGLALAAESLRPERIIIALKAKHAELVRHLEERLAKEALSPPVELALLGDYYPAGDEQVLVYDVLGAVVKRGSLPLSVGALVSNVETLINVARAAEGRAVTTTFVTVAGCVPAPATYELPVGMSYREALGLAGVEHTDGMRAIDGGPLMGKLIASLDQPLTKTTKAVILLDQAHRVVAEKSMSDEQLLRQSRVGCLQCQKCSDLCPRGLLGHRVNPHLIMRIATYRLRDFAGMEQAFGCSECGACALYSCPSGLSPRRVFMLIKKQLAEAGVRPVAPDKDPLPSDMFAYRKIPVKRLVKRLGLAAFDKPAPLGQAPAAKPRAVTLLLKQHVGAPATATVAEGDRVERGALVGEMAEGALGARVHASISGTVARVDSTAVVIERDE